MRRRRAASSHTAWLLLLAAATSSCPWAATTTSSGCAFGWTFCLALAPLGGRPSMPVVRWGYHPSAASLSNPEWERLQGYSSRKQRRRRRGAPRDTTGLSSLSSASLPNDNDATPLLPVDLSLASSSSSSTPLLTPPGGIVVGIDGIDGGVVTTLAAEAVALLPLEPPMATVETTVPSMLGVRSIEIIVVDDDNNNKESASQRTEPPLPPPRRFVQRKFRSSVSDLLRAALVGVVSGLSVAVFKLSIEAVREISYQQDVLASAEWLRAIIPATGGGAVGLLLLLDKNRGFPPGLRGVVKIVDDQERSGSDDSLKGDWRTQVQTQVGAVRKSIAAVFTLGSGCSLGPEGPCVEIGMTVARACMDLVKPRAGTPHWNLLLLSCGAAAGVAAGFNAPIAGVFFALEVVQNAWLSIREERSTEGGVAVGVGAGQEQPQQQQVQSSADNIDRDNQIMGGWMGSTSTIAPVLLASIISALIARTLLGNHLVLALTEYSLKTPLLELPLYLGLGAVSGAIAFVFSQMAKLSNAFFAGNVGPQPVREGLRAMPAPVKPIIGGILCGVVGIYFPQILFFGYETLNALLANNALSTSLVLILLLVKMVMTALSAGSGLVGGTFAPSLFLGAMTGAAFHNIMSSVLLVAMQVGFLQGLPLELADIPAYAMVGAASVLAALFRAPLTASLLLFELTRDYDVILPLMASAGVASLVGDILDDKLEQSRLHLIPRDQDHVSWGVLADKDDSSTSTQR